MVIGGMLIHWSKTFLNSNPHVKDAAKTAASRQLTQILLRLFKK